jgi:hypothetical protein
MRESVSIKRKEGKDRLSNPEKSKNGCVILPARRKDVG